MSACEMIFDELLRANDGYWAKQFSDPCELAWFRFGMIAVMECR